VPSTGGSLVSDILRHRVICFCSIDDDTLVGSLGEDLGSGPTDFECPFGLVVLDGPSCTQVCCSSSFVIFTMWLHSH
jgi:hypothetical protein